MAYKRTTVNLAILKPHERSTKMHDYELIPFPAYASKHHALAIHRLFERSDNEKDLVEIKDGLWQISHKGSGQHCFSFGLLKDAMTFSGALFASCFDPFDKVSGALLPRDEQPENLSKHLMDLLVLHYGSR